MNTNDLPPAARLAAMIEVGRAAYPGLRHGQHGELLRGDEACAVAFAGLGAGVPLATLRGLVDVERAIAVERALGMCIEVSKKNLLWQTMMLNDKGATLREICDDLREGRLATIAA